MPGPSSAVETDVYPEPMYLPSYEEMTIDEKFNEPSSMETQSDIAPVQVLEEGVAVTQDGRTVEWWPMNESVTNTELDEYLQDENKPLIPTLSFLIKDCTLPALSSLEVFRTNRLRLKHCVTRYTPTYSITGVPLAVIAD